VTGARQALVTLLAGALEEAAAAAPSLELVPDVREFGSTEVAQLLGRGHGWAARHAAELGAYRETPRGRLRFPEHGVRRYQERLAAEQARAGMRAAS